MGRNPALPLCDKRLHSLFNSLSSSGLTIFFHVWIMHQCKKGREFETFIRIYCLRDRI